jgi:hypothetical protein
VVFATRHRGLCKEPTMRKGLLSSVATALVGAGSALAQNPYLPTDATARPTGPAASVPALLSADPAPAPAMSGPTAPPSMSCGSTGLVPGVDCLPAAVPSHDKFWFDVSYMVAWIKNGPNPGPLAVATPIGGGVINTGSVVLVGNRDSEFDPQNGIRASAGMWFGCDAKVGFEARGFVLERTTDSEAAVSTGAANLPVNLLRPFVTGAGTVAAIPVGGPGVAGGIVADASTRFWGAEGNFLLNWRDDCNRRVDLYAGFIYYDLLERLAVSSVTTIPGFASLVLSDAIDTRNQFYAGQVGMKSTWTRGRLSVIGSGGLAMGVVHEVVDRYGSSSTAIGGAAPVGTNTGFLVQSSNRGRVSQDKFAIAMPSNLTLSYQVTDHLSAFIGYDFVYLSRAARPGDQTDLAFQTNAAGTTVRPLGGIHSDDFWMNAGLIGVKFKF